MEALVNAAVMRESDAAAIRSGVCGRELMLRAARGVFESYPWKGRVSILCGGGNNAGDGYALALLLQDAGISCRVLRVVDQATPDGAFYLERCLSAGVQVSFFDRETDLTKEGALVDCLLGTGFAGEVRGQLREVIHAINAAHVPVISVDINSGLDATSGQASLAVRSDLTVSVGTRKYGHFLGDGRDLIQRLCNVDIGIKICGEQAHLLSAARVREILGERKHNSHKGDYGYVALMGGCREYAGAIKLASMSCAALRAGAGVATLAVPRGLADAVSPYLLESTLLPMPEDSEGRMQFSKTALDLLCEHRTALAVGMGWGRGRDTTEILAYLLKEKEIRIIIDADGLYALSLLPHKLLTQSRCQIVLTPHMGEFSRLIGQPVREILRDPVRFAKEYAAQTGVVLLLKGATTVVSDGKEILFVDRGSAGMATAGSGDVLSGVLCGLLGSREADPWTVAAGAYLAGRAGELAAEAYSELSMLASDTVAMLPQAVREVMEEL